VAGERLRRWRSRLRRERASPPSRAAATGLIPLAPVVVRAFTAPAEQPRHEPLTPAPGVDPTAWLKDVLVRIASG